MKMMMGALRIGAPELNCLGLQGIEDGAIVAVALQGLLDGSCSRLTELDLSHSTMKDGINILPLVLQGQAPCSTTLSSINLSSCEINAKVFKPVTRTIAAGAKCPALLRLNFSNNPLGDRGVKMLVEAFAVGHRVDPSNLSNLRELELRHVRSCLVFGLSMWIGCCRMVIAN